jgi:hypothetical protein
MPRKHLATVLFITTAVAAGLSWVGADLPEYPPREQLATATGVPAGLHMERRGGFVFHVPGITKPFEWRDNNVSRDAMWRALSAGTTVTVRYVDRYWPNGHIEAVEVADANGIPVEPYDAVIQRTESGHRSMMAAATALWLIALAIAFRWARAWSRKEPGTYDAAF